MADYYVTHEERDNILDLRQVGDIVRAVKEARTTTGASIAVAKRWVDAMCPILKDLDGVVWDFSPETQETVPELVSRLFELSEQIAEVHNKLAKMGVEHDKS